MNPVPLENKLCLNLATCGTFIKENKSTEKEKLF